MTAEEVIAKLGLTPLPGEGGYYRETYRSAESISEGLSFRYGANATRSTGTAIYYFLTPETFSALHRLKSDEVYHFYRGDPVQLTTIDSDGNVQQVLLGSRFEEGERCQFVVPAGVWQGSRLIAGGKWALLGTTVAPGFIFEDCELASASSFPASLLSSPEVHSLLPSAAR
jgi:predicted cupin superfamily sugar epimerase